MCHGMSSLIRKIYVRGHVRREDFAIGQKEALQVDARSSWEVPAAWKDL